jgi:Kdo2-lipid IVA lauroyltransferase/acyltransferase
MQLVCYFTPLKKNHQACVAFLMLVTLFRLLSALPLPLLHAFGAALGWLVYLLSPSYRRRMKDNIARAGHGSSLKAAVSEAGKNVLELPFVWCGKPERVLASATIDNAGVVDEALAGGRGVILLTPHLGCFEIIAQVLASRMPLTVLYRPPRKSALKPLIEGARARQNLHLAPANLTGVRMLLKALKGGGAIGLLPDQVPQNGEGIWAGFFGQPAYTMTLPGKMHDMTGAPIVLTYAERLPHGRGFVVRFVPFDGPLGDTPQDHARAINAVMERLIARCPAQYFWSYNRYKVPAGVTPPEGNEARE